jgi:hypothetical protein
VGADAFQAPNESGSNPCARAGNDAAAADNNTSTKRQEVFPMGFKL